MENKGSFAELALAGVARMRDRDCDFRGRVSALLLLLRGAYYTGEEKWRALAEEDLRALWRGGVHDHIGGGFFSACRDAEFLHPPCFFLICRHVIGMVAEQRQRVALCQQLLWLFFQAEGIEHCRQ